ncbi:MAG: SLC13 family permease [Phycisphaerae bacterium]|nr:SLC13 family permease [Phycisphaerae bacterium]
MVPEAIAPWVVAATVCLVVVAIVLGVGADVAMLAGLIVLAILGLVNASQAVSGFANEGMLTVATLYVVVAGLQSTGAISRLTGPLLRNVRTERGALMRLCIPIAAISAFLNNTPIVAVMIPVVTDWAKRTRIPVSRLLMPLSYATILGGTVTLIGTSTNLVVLGLIQSQMKAAEVPGLRPIGFFDLTYVGVPLALIGVAYIIIATPKLLPIRTPVLDVDDDARRYTARVRVIPNGPFDGKSIEAAGLRNLQGLFVAEIERGDDTLSAPAPETVLRGGDVIVFAGVLETVRDLLTTRGLASAESDPEPDQRAHTLTEAVVGTSFPGLGQTIRDFGFRGRYDAVILAVARDGKRVQGRIGDVIPEPGDTLLIQADPEFAKRWRDSRDFFLVGRVDGSASVSHERAWIAVGILVVMVAAATWNGNMLGAAAVAAGLMLLTRCVSATQARNSIDLSTLLTIAASIGISRAVETTGLGKFVGEGLVRLAQGHAVGSIAAIYVATMIFTAVVSNSAAAAIMFPIALGAAAQIGGDPMPYVLAILFAASADFATPIGYQTNLMVYGPGGYRFSDYLRLGIPLNLLALIVTTVMLSLSFRLI